jgi:hypothetical protein
VTKIRIIKEEPEPKDEWDLVPGDSFWQREVFNVEVNRLNNNRQLAECPTCGYHATVYRHTMNTGQLITMVHLLRTEGQNWQQLDTNQTNRSEARACWWKVMDRVYGRPPWYRVTQLGEDFLHGRVTIPKYAVAYQGKLLRLEGDPWHISQVKNFDLDRLMRGE